MNRCSSKLVIRFTKGGKEKECLLVWEVGGEFVDLQGGLTVDLVVELGRWRCWCRSSYWHSAENSPT